jgi:hypothetical protein
VKGEGEMLLKWVDLNVCSICFTFLSRPCQVLVLSPLKASLKIGEEDIIGALYLLIQLVSLSLTSSTVL